MIIPPPLVAYIGPETIVPATSALAALGGIVLLLPRYVARAIHWCVCKVRGRAGSVAHTSDN